MTLSTASIKALALVLTVVALLASSVVALADYPVDVHNDGQSQAWGERNSESQGYGGVDAYVSFTPNSSVDGWWVAAPTALGQATSAPYIESGPYYECGFPGDDCKIHPYMSYQDSSGNGAKTVDTTVILASGGNYQYSSYFVGNNDWSSFYEDGNGWHQVNSVNLGTSTSLTYVMSGGEGQCMYCKIGSVYSSGAQYELGGTTTWYNWCYSNAWVSVSGSGASVSACGSNHDWTSAFN